MAAVASSSNKFSASINRIEPGSHPTPIASYPKHAAFTQESPTEVAEKWLDQFNANLSSSNAQKISNQFMKESYWRDQLCLSFDYHTLHGPRKIADFLSHLGKSYKIRDVAPDTSAPHKSPAKSALDFHGKVPCVQVWITFKTDVGSGVGILKLVQDVEDSNRYKAYTLFTTLRELTGHEEAIGKRRPKGVDHGGHVGRKNWLDRRLQEQEEVDPVVMIIGAGQGGLTLAARLKMLGVPALLVDTNERIGDSWRKRYHQLVLHDPVWYDHLPYLPFPSFWPEFTPKDKLAKWFENYVECLELNAWTSSQLKTAQWDGEAKQWTVSIDRMIDGKIENRVLHPKHIVQATGHSGEKNFPTHITGLDSFQGDRLCHSSEFTGAKEDGKGKRAIVVGCCNSGHDIAQDFYEKGYDVTIVQRSSTYVMSSDKGLKVLLGKLYYEGGMPVEDADLVFMSSPFSVTKRSHHDVTAEIRAQDAELIKGLQEAGFQCDFGPEDCGFFTKYFQRGGGYYIDVGCSQLIIDRKIKVKQGQEIKSVMPHSLTFADGDELPADEIVFATGYQNMRGTARKIFGDEVADKLKDVWGMDEEGELRTMWRDSGHPGFWYMGGNLALCRYYSRLLALQIKAKEVGLYE